MLDANIGDIMEFLSEKSQDDLSGNDYYEEHQLIKED